MSARSQIFTVVLVLAAGAGFAQQPIRSDSKLVLVDSIVTGRKGVYVTDLAQKNFRVFEDGKEQAIASFSFQGAQPGQKHYLVLLFDDSSIAPANQRAARDAATSLIDANVSADRPMSVMEYARALRITQDFTDNADRLKQAVGESRLAAAPEQVVTGGGRAGRLGQAGQFGVDSRIEMSALRDAARGLEAIPGRKTVIFLSGGFSANPEDLSNVTAAFSRADTAIYPVDLGRHTGAAISSGDLTSGIDVAEPAGASSRTSTRGGRGDGGGGGAEDASSMRGPVDVLSQLASGTGGFVTARTNDLAASLGKIGQEQLQYYTLAYIPAKDSKPGACHTLKVKVDRGGTSVRARSGYCAPR